MRSFPSLSSSQQEEVVLCHFYGIVFWKTVVCLVSLGGWAAQGLRCLPKGLISIGKKCKTQSSATACLPHGHMLWLGCKDNSVAPGYAAHTLFLEGWEVRREEKEKLHLLSFLFLLDHWNKIKRLQSSIQLGPEYWPKLHFQSGQKTCGGNRDYFSSL